MSLEASSGDRSWSRAWWLALALALIPLGGWFLPADAAVLEGMDSRRVGTGLGIFVCIAILWLREVLPLPATALLVPLLACFFVGTPAQEALGAFADPLIFLFLGGFGLASALKRQGVDRWLAGRLVRMGGGRFLPVAGCLFACTALLSMWMSNTATAALMLPSALGLLARMGPAGRQENNRHFLLLGLAYASSIGGLGTVIGSPPNGIAARQLGWSFADWLRMGIPAVVILLPAMVLLLAWCLRPDRGLSLLAAGGEGDVPESGSPRGKMAVGLVFGLTAAAWMAGAWLGPRLGIAAGFDTLVALAALLVLFASGLLRWGDLQRDADWGVLLLFGGGIALSGVLRDTGASLLLARLLAGQMGGLPVPLVIAAVVAAVIFLTELSSNTAVAALFVPLFAAVAHEAGTSPALLLPPLALAASCAFMLPVATPPNAIVFATGAIRQRTMMRCGLVLNLSFVLLLTALALLWL